MHKKIVSYVLMVMLLMSLLVSGCEVAKVNSDSQRVASNAKSSTVLDIKKKYGSDTEKAIMPMYNVEKNKEFIFKYNYRLGKVNTSDIASVYTDIKCLPESEILASIWCQDSIKDNKSELSIKPLGGVLLSKSDLSNKGAVWGNAPIYYIKLNYDMDAKTSTKLKKPIIIPFTVKSNAPVPNLRYEIGADNRFKLVWDAVPGAEKYNIYNASKITLRQTTNEPISGPEAGYAGVSPRLENTISDTQYNDFLKDGHGALNSQENGEIVMGQNLGIGGEYYVTAVVNGKESNFSKPVNTVKLSKELPHKLKSDLPFSTFESVNNLPLAVQVEYIDGSIQDKEVIFETQGLETKEFGGTQVWFRIKDTAFRSYVLVKMKKEDVAVLQSKNTSDAESGYVKPENTIDTVPKPEVPTIIDGKNTPSKDNSIDTQKKNTENQVKQGNQEKVEIPPAVKDVKPAADTALEEYLALQMLNGKKEISLKAFPEAQNFDTLCDSLQKVIYQNPLIIGVKKYGYDYNKITLVIEYNNSVDKIKKQQEEILLEAKKIVASTIKSGMTDEQKRKALYDYLNDNTKYDNSALESAEKNNFKDVSDEFNDSFTTYGIMVKKVGVCMSYAYTYKMLCNLAGLQSIVVTGAINSLPHAWNKVKIDNQWVHVDTTNNLTNSGIPYMLYNANDETSKQINYITDDSYWIDSQLSRFVSTSNKYEYYATNGLEVSSLNEYKSKVADKLKQGANLIVLRFAAKIDQNQLMSTTTEVFNSFAKDKLDNAKMGELGKYIIITY